jgi:hypothetical protein
MEPEIKSAVTKTILLFIALLGVGAVAISVLLDMRSLPEALLGVLILVSLIIIVVVSFLSSRGRG